MADVISRFALVNLKTIVHLSERETGEGSTVQEWIRAAANERFPESNIAIDLDTESGRLHITRDGTAVSRDIAIEIVRDATKSIVASMNRHLFQ